MANAKQNRRQNDSTDRKPAAANRKIEPPRKAPDSERGLTHSPYFNGPLYHRMSEDLHLGGMSKRTHEGYLRAVLRREILLHPDLSARVADTGTDEDSERQVVAGSTDHRAGSSDHQLLQDATHGRVLLDSVLPRPAAGAVPRPQQSENRM
jgi:hypothetical protein